MCTLNPYLLFSNNTLPCVVKDSDTVGSSGLTRGVIFVAFYNLYYVFIENYTRILNVFTFLMNLVPYSFPYLILFNHLVIQSEIGIPVNNLTHLTL